MLGLLMGPAQEASRTSGLDPAAIEQQIGRLQLKHDDRIKAQDWDGALDAIREALALDGDHPVPYRQAVLMLRRRDQVDKTAELLGSLDPDGRPGRVYGEGVALFFVPGKRAEARQAFERALAMYAARGHAAGQAASHTALGNLDRQAGKWTEALAHDDAAVPWLEQLGDRIGMADVRANQAQMERRLGRPEAALERQRQVLAIREELGDMEGQARSWQEIGTCLFETKDTAGAREALQRALAMHRASGNKALEGHTLRILAWISESLGVDREALDDLTRAAEAFAAAGVQERQWQADATTAIGETLRRMGEYERARETLESAREMASGLKDRKLPARILTNLGVVHAALWEIPIALSALQQALDIHRQLKDARGELHALDTMVAIHHAVGDLESARRLLESRPEVAARLGDPLQSAKGHNNLGANLVLQGRLDAALEQFNKAETIWQENREALQGNEPLRMAFVRNRAELLMERGSLEEAGGLLEGSLDTSRSLMDRKGELFTLNLMGALEAKRSRHEQALKRHGGALALAEAMGLAEEEWRARIGMAESMEKLGRHQEAVAQALRALDKVESVRAQMLADDLKVRFFAGRVDLYKRTLTLLLPEGRRIDEAAARQGLEVSERARARGLLDLLMESRHGMRKKLSSDLRERERRALDDVSAATQQLVSANGEEAAAKARELLRRAEEALQRLELDMRSAAPAYANVVYPRPASTKDVQAALGSDEALLEYFIGRNEAWVWVVERKKVAVYRLASPQVIRQAVEKFLKGAGAPGASLAGEGPDPASHALSEAILPAGGSWTARRLLIAPDGPLHHVPFEALVHKGHYLLEEHEIATVPSATTMLWMRSEAASRAARGFLGVADATPGADVSLSLPYSRLEVEGIAGLFEEPQRSVLLGDKVSRASLTDPSVKDFRYVHFATHGLLGHGSPGDRRTGLWLGKGAAQGPDTILTLPEIVTLPLDADLVVLSSCRSGEGELLGGEGMIGLTRAFLQAGARAVVMSVWNVSDQSTVDLMQTFYRGLRSGATPGAALRQAKLEFIRSERPARREPYRWAPFVLVGAPTR
ncbi:MAG: CHAT domain-containing protein [Candidatus Polarisedimenticolia bacterium]